MPKGIKGFQKGHPNFGGYRFKKGHLSTNTLEGNKKTGKAQKARKHLPQEGFQKGKPHLWARKEKSHLWKGGITPLLNQVRQCFKYRQWRSDIFTRDDFTCQDCGKRGGNLEAHHIERFTDIFYKNKIKTLEQALVCEELWNINNGRTLCLKCHIKTKK